MKVYILAGGGGTRLYPLSTEEKPKQFLKLINDKSLLVNTIERFESLCSASDITVLTNEKYRALTQAELQDSGLGAVRILTEPSRKNTAPAITLAALTARESGCNGDEVLLFAPSDHAVTPTEAFCRALEEGIQSAQAGYITVFGVTPDRAETGYGYIQPGQKLASGYRVERFTEKPDAATAERFVREGYLWNGGLYCFTLDTFFAELKACAPQLFAATQNGLAGYIQQFDRLDSISIDYALTEKTRKAAVIPMTLNWSDIGSWERLNLYRASAERSEK